MPKRDPALTHNEPTRFPEANAFLFALDEMPDLTLEILQNLERDQVVKIHQAAAQLQNHCAQIMSAA